MPTGRDTDDKTTDDRRTGRTDGTARARRRRVGHARAYGGLVSGDGYRVQRPREPRHASGRGRRERLTGLGAAVLGSAATLAAAGLDLLFGDGLGVLFGLCFVLTALGIASTVRRQDVFAAAVLPPLQLLGTLIVLATIAGDQLAPEASSWLLTLLTGLADATWPLLIALAADLGMLALRVRTRLPLDRPRVARGEAREVGQR